MSSAGIIVGLGLGVALGPASPQLPDAALGTRSLDASAPTAVPAAPLPEPVVVSGAAEDLAEQPAPVAVEPIEVAAAPLPVRDQPTCDEEPPALWGGFKVSSKDERHSLKVGFLGQLRTTLTDGPDQGPQGGFAVRLARPTLVAQLWEGRVAMRFMPEFAGANVTLLDATATVKANDAFAVQVGQFRPWLSRGFRTGLPVTGLPGRGAIVDRYRVDRDVGVTVRGKPWGGKFEYYFGLLNGSGINAREWAPSPLLTARVVVAPVGEAPYTQTPYARNVGPRSDDRNAPAAAPLAVAIGASGYTVSLREDSTLSTGDVVRTSPRRRVGASGDIVVSRRRVFAMSEGFYEHRAAISEMSIPADDAYGVYGQAGVLVWGPWLDVTFRTGVLSDQGERVPIEPGINAYIVGNHAKVQVSYRCDVSLAADASAGCSAHVGTLQAQLLF